MKKALRTVVIVIQPAFAEYVDTLFIKAAGRATHDARVFILRLYLKQ